VENSSLNITNEHPSDEIDLFELWEQVWSQKIMLIIVTIISMFLGVLLAFSIPAEYRSTTYMLPPQLKDIQALNINAPLVSGDASRLVFKQYGAGEVYKRFLTNLESRGMRLAYFNENELLNYAVVGEVPVNENKVFEDFFNKKLQLSEAKQSQGDNQVTFSFSTNDPLLAAKLNNEFIEEMFLKTVNDLSMEVMLDVERLKATLDEQINSRRAVAEQRRLDRLTELEEALIIAEAINLEFSEINQVANNLSMEYMRGFAAINAELTVLKSRESDDPFILGLRDLQEQIDFLSNVVVDTSRVKVAIIDQKAIAPDSPVKPNKKLIVAVSLVLGLMLGVFIALIRSAVRKRRLSE